MSDVIPPNQNSLEDAVKVLDATYQNGLNYRKHALSDLEDYVDGKYVENDGSRTITPKINYMYRTWFLVVAKLLTYNVVSRRLRHDFMKSEATNDLDEYLFNNDFTKAKEDIEKAYNSSLEALVATIDDLRKLGKSERKIISLKKIRNAIYLHIEEDDDKVKIHEFAKDSPLEAVFDYVYLHPNETVTPEQIDFSSRGYRKRRNLSEDLRATNINTKLKKLFFPVCRSDKLLFENKAQVSKEELGNLLAELKSDLE